MHNSSSRMLIRSQTMRVALVICLACFSRIALAALSFDEQRKIVSSSLATQSESTILSLLEAGIAEEKPTQAIALTKLWLRQNVAENPLLLFHAGHAAELSGDWNSAVALYQQYLKRADLKSATAETAVLAAYTLQIDQLSDEEGAYAFGRNQGHRLLACVQARQFDTWFLDMAVRRKDRQAVAERLLACISHGVPNDLLIARYDTYFHWLLDAINSARYDVDRFSPEFCTNVKELAAAISFDDELKLRLDWVISVKQYNMALLDGNEMVPPLGQATALLKRSPQYAELIQTGWAGGSRSQYYRGDPKIYWLHMLEGKLAPLRAALPKMPPLNQAELLSSWGSSYYSSGPQVLSAEESLAFLQANPKLLGSKAIGAWPQFWNAQMTVEQAKKLMPLLAQNPTPEVSLIGAIAAGGEEKDYDKAIAALLGPEAWRLTERELGGTYADTLWHWSGRPGGNQKRDEQIAKSKAFAATFAKADVKKEDPVAKRMALFKKLWSDFRSAKPKIPAVRTRLAKVLGMTPEAVPELLRDRSPEAQMLVRDVIAKGFEGPEGPLSGEPSVRGLSPSRYDPSILRKQARHSGNMDYVRTRVPQAYRAYPLEPALRKTVADLLKQGKAEPWLTMAWINAQFMEDNEESLKVMTALIKSPAYKTLPYEVRYGVRSWFKRDALSPAQVGYLDASDPEMICRDLLALPKEADVPTTVAALSKAIEGIKKSPVRVEIIGLDQLAALDDAVFSDPRVMTLMLQIVDPLRTFHRDTYSIPFDNRLLKVVFDQRQPDILHKVAPYFWRHTELYHRPLSTMMEYVESLVDENPSAASTLARCGLQTFARYRHGHHYFNNETDIPRLLSVRGKASLAMRLIEIPVPATDPAYPIYKSQAEFATGNEESAKEFYDVAADQLLPVHRNLSVSYLLWILQQTIDHRDEDRQESLAKALLNWMQESTMAFSLDQKISLEIAYGDIAMQRGMLPEAHAIFTRIQNNEDYHGILSQNTATLRRVQVERISKDFDAALKTLDALEMQRIPRVTTASHHARAEVYFDMEEYEDAADEVAKVLERDPTHADATILRGRIQLKLKRLIEATEVELGTASRQKTLVPGEALKVTLNDPTLAVSSGGSEIEVVVWATSGDKEHLLLRQFGDVKTKYRGEVKTALGRPAPSDKILQIVGEDKIFYAYSEAFRKKVTNLEENRGGPISVASDAMLIASARKLLTESEQRVADMAAVTAALEAKRATAAERTDPIRLAAMKAEVALRAQKRLLTARAKPGNPIHVRVIDPDRSRTPEIDELDVSAFASSGDVVGRMILKETGTHTGLFEGVVPTASAQAMAFGSTSETGRNPNMVISPKTDYPAWRPVASRETAHTFSVDLNDNSPLGSLAIESKDAGFELKSFLVQTAMNHTHWTTVARYPTDPIGVEPWLPSVTVMNETDRLHASGARSVYDQIDLLEHIRTGWMRQQYAQAVAQNVAGPSQALPESIPTALEWRRQARWDNPVVVVRFDSYFYEPRTVTRRFRLMLGTHEIKKDAERQQLPEFCLVVDRRVLTEKDGKLEGQIHLKPGLHRLEIWATGWMSTLGFGRTVTLQANLKDDDRMVPCPDSMFDPKTFPEGLMDRRNSPAKIAASENGTRFDVTFAPDSRARLLRLVFVDQQGPVPSLNRLTLRTPEGDMLLPAPQDFAALRKNQLLEILTGDQVTIRYVDDRHVTAGKEKHERFLNVAYTSARIEFADIEPRYSSRHQRKMPYHERILRFRHGERLPVLIYDADMDVSVEIDEVSWSTTDSRGNERTFVAKETGPSTGVFRTFVTPVDRATEDGATVDGATEDGATVDKTQIELAEGSTLRAVYRDVENTDPGVSTDRYATIAYATFQTPVIQLAHMTVSPVEAGDHRKRERLHPDFVPDYIVERQARRIAIQEQMVPHFKIRQSFIASTNVPAKGYELVHGRHALIDVVAPQLALAEHATIDIYVQTDTGRKQASSKPFDLNVPGTLKLIGRLGQLPRNDTPQRAGYMLEGIEGEVSIEESFASGRFRAVVPLIPGMLPEQSLIDPEELKKQGIDRPHGLVVRSGERMHIGISYKDRQGAKKWLTTSAKIITHPMLDVMKQGYRTSLTNAFVGEKVHLRVVDFAQDRTDDRDRLPLYMASKSGAKHHVFLLETDTHTGIFKGVYQLTYNSADSSINDDDNSTVAEYNVQRLGFPVIYGDMLGVRYTDASGRKTPVQYVSIGKGSNGTIAPFSKQYDDSETAMHTQFAMAESYLELARRHRKTGEIEQAAREFVRAKQLLANAIQQFHDPETRAHAEYLLGNLTEEDAGATSDAELREARYHAALARFMNITGAYPDTEYASKAQFKIAVIYERLKESDIAAEEYVKLAYKYPDSEHLATAMARLGTHFQRKASEYEKEATPLLARVDDQDALHKGTALQTLMRLEYVKSAQIFERLQARFPDHELAGKAGLRAGQTYMRAEKFTKAIATLHRVIDDESYDGKTLRSEAMYWAAKCYQSLNQQLPAYALYKRITYDFPESKWAAYARGQLSQEKLLELDRRLEIERLEEGR